MYNNHMFTFDEDELAAIVKVAKNIAMEGKNGTIEKSEMDFIYKELSRFGVVGNNAEDLLAHSEMMDFSDAIRLIKSMDIGSKAYITAYLGVLATVKHSDDIMGMMGIGGQSKIWKWGQISSLAQLPEMTIPEAFDFMEHL